MLSFVIIFRVMRSHPHYSLSRILTSMCFPNAFAYFSSINNVGILVPPSNLAIFDVLTPVISDNSCCVSFCLFPPPIVVSLRKNPATLLIESYPHMPATFSLFFPFHSDILLCSLSSDPLPTISFIELYH